MNCETQPSMMRCRCSTLTIPLLFRRRRRIQKSKTEEESPHSMRPAAITNLQQRHKTHTLTIKKKS